jgi:UDP:flavonoid glycosyltransferase YjiC (YdhE family)
MRALFTFAGGRGHAEPLIPIAAATRAAGHAVAFSGRAWVAAGLRERGFDVLPDPEGAMDEPPPLQPLAELDPEREEAMLRNGFAAGIARERADLALAACAAWAPDVVVCDEVDFGGMVAAARLGLPQATVIVTAAGSFLRRDIVEERLRALRAAHGLASDPGPGWPPGDLVLAPAPPSFRDPAFPLPPAAVAIRPEGADVPPRRSGPRPVVYATLGTAFNVESGDLFERLLAGLAEVGAEAIVTVGRGVDPARFGPQPAHVRIAADLPQSEVLPGCAAVVSHGGSGTVMGALAAGLPQVLLPMGADQPHNAARCAALGAGIVLDVIRAGPAAIAAAVRAVLDEPRYGVAAARLRAEAAALPPPEQAVRLLERLAAEGANARPRGRA